MSDILYLLGPDLFHSVRFQVRPLHKRGFVLATFSLPLKEVYFRVLLHMRSTYRVDIPINVSRLPDTHPDDQLLPLAVASVLSTPIPAVQSAATMRVSVARSGQHPFAGPDLERAVGWVLHGRGLPVNLTSPELNVCVGIEGSFMLTSL